MADYTLRLLQRVVPPAVPGIFFLSGGLTDEEATLNLDAMHRGDLARDRRHPWLVSYSYARGLQAAAMQAWAGLDANREAAQAALLRRAELCSAAQQGRCDYGAYHAGSE